MTNLAVVSGPPVIEINTTAICQKSPRLNIGTEMEHLPHGADRLLACWLLVDFSRLSNAHKWRYVGLHHANRGRVSPYLIL
jgi:hypothetical protein